MHLIFTIGYMYQCTIWWTCGLWVNGSWSSLVSRVLCSNSCQFLHVALEKSRWVNMALQHGGFPKINYSWYLEIPYLIMPLIFFFIVTGKKSTQSTSYGEGLKHICVGADSVTAALGTFYICYNFGEHLLSNQTASVPPLSLILQLCTSLIEHHGSLTVQLSPSGPPQHLSN